MTTHCTLFGIREKIKLNNPNPNAVPDTIRSSTGPSGATSIGRTGLDADVPTQREKKLLLKNVFGRVCTDRMAVEFAARAGKNGEDWSGNGDLAVSELCGWTGIEE